MYIVWKSFCIIHVSHESTGRLDVCCKTSCFATCVVVKNCVTMQPVSQTQPCQYGVVAKTPISRHHVDTVLCQDTFHTQKSSYFTTPCRHSVRCNTVCHLKLCITATRVTMSLFLSVDTVCEYIIISCHLAATSPLHPSASHLPRRPTSRKVP